MEKHTVTNICRLGGALIIAALTVSAAHANSLSNPGFETAGTNDASAANWNIFGNAARNGTNNTLTTIRTGFWSLAAGTTALTNSLVGSGAFQDVPAGAGDTWRLTGYILTWINAKATGPDSFGVGQLAFLDSNSNIISSVDSPHFGQTANMPVNTWVPFEVDATAPAGTAFVRTYLLYVGDNNDAGNYFFDDLNLYKPSSSSTASITSSQRAVQVSWPTSPSTNGIDYQIQYTPNLVFTNPPVANVLTNGGFETNAAPWFAFNGAGQTTATPRHSGTGVMKLAHNGSTVPGCFQTFSGITPGSVWNLSGFGYNWSSQPMFQANTRALIKIVWLNNSGSTVAAVNGDTNLIGTVDFAPNAGVVSGVQMSSASPQNTWIFLEAQATAPTNATQIQCFCLLVPVASPTVETCLFDDIVAFQVTTALAGWNNFGPLWLGTGLTNQTYDVVGTNSTKFYRVTTP